MVIGSLFGLATSAASYVWPTKRLERPHPRDDLWAVVTGATSGVGLALSVLLCTRGFNVVIHGRDSEKLDALKSSLAARFPERKCETLLLDAANCFSRDQYDSSRDAVLKATSNRNVMLLINNVGIGHNLTNDFRLLTRQTPPAIDLLLNTNIGFMTHLTHIMVPVLSESTPSSIINIGSLAELAMPYLTVYSATKAYMSTFTKALDAEMHAQGLDITVECMVFGDIDTPGHVMRQSLSVLGPTDAAKCVLDRAGSIGYMGTQPVGAPYWFHGFLLWMCEIQPWWMLRAGFVQNLKSKQTHPRQE